ncbi:inhibitor of host transcription [Providencia phage PSTCR6]|nr:inhibitor of host transcription [Providencia phage PSTCR6]
MNLQSITNEQLVEAYGTHHDGIYVYNGKKTVGFITDLRIAYGRKQKTRTKQKEYSNRINEKRRDAMPEAVEEMKQFLESHLAKYDAEVFINITQPNVHINGHKCYIIVDPIYQKHSIGIMHASMNYDEMAAELPGYNVQPNSSRNHILVRSIERDLLLEIILQLCKK